MPYKTTIELEMDDDAGWHAIVIDADGDEVLFISNSYVLALDAQRAAREWLDRQPPASRPA